MIRKYRFQYEKHWYYSIGLNPVVYVDVIVGVVPRFRESVTFFQNGINDKKI